jgi:predicted nuclease of predicted toxin-antitoxin system
MRFLANENFPRLAVEELREDGHDVSWVRTEAPGSSDDAVLARARGETRVLLTFDEDFGELVLKRGAGASIGVVLFRLPLALPLQLSEAVRRAIASRSDWAGHFSVVEPGRVRMRPLGA